MKSTSVQACKCKNEFQDEFYGKGLRLHNYMKKKNLNDTQMCRCTSCEAVKEVKDTRG